MIDDIVFSKLSGSGNDHICIDNRDRRYDPIVQDPVRVGRLVRALCRRRLSIGADGVIFACPMDPDVEEFADVAARFFDADGTEAELCGNGTACFTHWVVANGWLASKEIQILTSAGVVRGQNGQDNGGYVRVCIPLPEDIRHDLHVTTSRATFSCDYVVTGVPHLVTYVDDVEQVDVARVGADLRHHEMFQPRGVNVNFVEVIEEGHIANRTFEFGVEDETLACGTGSASAAILTALRYNWDRRFLSGDEPVLVSPRSGQTLRVWFEIGPAGKVVDLCLDSTVRYLYSGSVHPELLIEAVGDEPSCCRVAQ